MPFLATVQGTDGWLQIAHSPNGPVLSDPHWSLEEQLQPPRLLQVRPQGKASRFLVLSQLPFFFETLPGETAREGGLSCVYLAAFLLSNSAFACGPAAGHQRLAPAAAPPVVAGGATSGRPGPPAGGGPAGRAGAGAASRCCIHCLSCRSAALPSDVSRTFHRDAERMSHSSRVTAHRHWTSCCRCCARLKTTSCGWRKPSPG